MPQLFENATIKDLLLFEAQLSDEEFDSILAELFEDDNND